MAEEALPQTSLRPSVDAGERDDARVTFFNVRPRLFGIGYRMRESAAEGGDVVQGVWMWCFALLVRLAAFAGWMLSRFTVPPRARWVNRVGAVGILALLYSTVSPDYDGFQQELIRPGTPVLTVPAPTRVAPRRSPADLSIAMFVEAGDPIRVPRTGRSFVMDQPLELDTHFHVPMSIHSPPSCFLISHFQFLCAECSEVFPVCPSTVPFTISAPSEITKGRRDRGERSERGADEIAALVRSVVRSSRSVAKGQI